ncbi:MAG: hypothetical protein AAB548_02680 [Patescibacteria group bacterium]
MMTKELYSALLSREKFDELLDKMGIVEPEKREAEWQSLREFFLIEIMRSVVMGMAETEKLKLEAGLNPENEDDRKKYYQRVDEYILAKKLSKERMTEVLKEAVEAAYNDYADKVKQK